MLNKILFALLAAVIILQFFQIDKVNPPADPSKDFMMVHNPPEDIKGMLKTACYDCHSHKTQYPWYTYTQPLGWWIKDHIDEGRDELNFSEWTDYSAKRADHKLEEAVEYISNEEMPLPSYTYSHWDADLSDEQRERLSTWFEELRPVIYPDSLREEDS